MASHIPDDMFSSCKVCNKKTTKTTILWHISKSKDAKHVRYKKSDEYQMLDNAIKKSNKLKKKENNKRYHAMTKDERHQKYLSQREEKLAYQRD